MSKVVSGVKWVAVETITCRLVGLVSTIYIARTLGPAAIGLIAILMIIVEIFTVVAPMGISQSIIQADNISRKSLAALYGFNWLLAAIVYGFIFLSAPILDFFFKEADLVQVVRWTGLVILIGAIGQQFFALFQKRLEFKVVAIVSIVSSILNAVIAIVLVLKGLGVWAVVWGYVFSAIFRNFVILMCAIKRGMFNGLSFGFKDAGEYLVVGMYQSGAMIINTVNSKLDQIIIGRLVGVSALGLYNMGSQLTVQVMQQINSISTRVMFPVVSSLSGDIKEVKKFYLGSVSNVLFLTSPLFLGLSALSKDFVAVFLGEKWADLSSVLSLLAVYALIRSLVNLNGPLIVGLGRSKWLFWWNALLLFVTPMVITLSAHSGGMYGVVSALIFYQSLLAFMSYFLFVKKLLAVGFIDYLYCFLPSFFCSGLMGAELLLLKSSDFFSDGAAGFFVLCVFGGIGYLFFSYFFNRAVMFEVLASLKYSGNQS